MERVTLVKPLPGHRLEVVFSDGVHGIVSLSERLFGPVFEPLRDETLFNQVGIDEFGAVFWPTGADLAPDALYEDVKETSMKRASGSWYVSLIRLFNSDRSDLALSHSRSFRGDPTY